MTFASSLLYMYFSYTEAIRTQIQPSKPITILNTKLTLGMGIFSAHALLAEFFFFDFVRNRYFSQERNECQIQFWV